ncbi:hypothetical protein AB6E88_18220 [Providencia hangzhouensis]
MTAPPSLATLGSITTTASALGVILTAPEANLTAKALDSWLANSAGNQLLLDLERIRSLKYQLRQQNS